MEAPKPSTEPVALAGLITFLASLIVTFAAKKGVELDTTTVVSLLTSAAGLALTFWARAKVHPDVKVQEKIADAHARGMALGAARASERPTVETTPPLGAA